MYDVDMEYEALPLFSTPRQPPADELLHEHKAEIVRLLQDGPKTCHEIDRATPARGQALICTLRRTGHLIDTQTIDGKRCYVYLGFKSDCVQVTKTMQANYYESEHWRSKRLERLAIDQNRCRQCGTEYSKDNPLDVHHWIYRLFNEDAKTDLITLCRLCHTMVHDANRGGACHFPRYLQAAVTERLLAIDSVKQ